jgi:hypothetical protein
MLLLDCVYEKPQGSREFFEVPSYPEVSDGTDNFCACGKGCSAKVV